MRDSEFWRVVEEICVLLKLNQPSTHQVIEFYKKLAASETHSFRPEIIIAACIFLVSKVQENQHKIRDILNICYVVTTLYKKANQEKGTEEIQYLNFVFIKEKLKDPKVVEEIIPSFSLDRYNEFKKLILEAQQHLLRVLNYDLDSLKTTNYKLLLSYMHYFKLPHSVCDLMIKIYNDSIFAEVEDNPKGCLFFTIRVAIKAAIVEQKEIDERLMDKQWWEEVMGCKYEKLLAYGEGMMQYYEEEGEIGEDQEDKEDKKEGKDAEDLQLIQQDSPPLENKIDQQE